MEREKGFTLVELLVVISIIGTLATVVLVSLNSARMKARDVRRVSDMRQTALALEMYYDSHSSTGYPGTAGSDQWAVLKTELEADEVMTVVPRDPGANAYEYWVSADHQDYVLKATLEEDGASALAGDVDGTALGCSCADPAYCIEP